MNDEPLMIEIPVVIKNGKVEFLHGELPRLKENTTGNLFIPHYGFQNPKDVERFLLIETIVILAGGTTLHAPMKDIGDKEIILEEPLRLTFRGTKKPALEDCRCTLPSLKNTARSVNEAYTRLSEKYEPRRRGHGGNVFQKVFYLPPGQHNWQPLDELRLAKQIAFQEKLFSRMPEKVKIGEDTSRIKLHSFIMELVKQWTHDREQDPEGMATAAEVTRTIWDSEETNRTFTLEEDAGALTIADVLETAGKNCFGGQQWSEMEDYINRLTPEERQQMNLQEFTGIFYDVLRDFGTPDGGTEESTPDPETVLEEMKPIWDKCRAEGVPIDRRPLDPNLTWSVQFQAQAEADPTGKDMEWWLANKQKFTSLE